LISWKHSFEVVSNELELISKKKKALDSLFSSGKISQATYDYINKELSSSLKEIEALQRNITDKMTARARELEKQAKSLEVFLANLEIYHAAGEVDQTTYNQQAEALKLGLEASNKELKEINQALLTLIPKTPVSAPEKTAVDVDESVELEEEGESTEEALQSF